MRLPLYTESGLHSLSPNSTVFYEQLAYCSEIRIKEQLLQKFDSWQSQCKCNANILRCFFIFHLFWCGILYNLDTLIFFFAPVPFGKIILAQIGRTPFVICNFYRHSRGAELNWGLGFDWAFLGHDPFLALWCDLCCMFQVVVLLKEESSSNSQCSLSIAAKFPSGFCSNFSFSLQGFYRSCRKEASLKCDAAITVPQCS